LKIKFVEVEFSSISNGTLLAPFTSLDFANVHESNQTI
jgi:hypothetical protein